MKHSCLGFLFFSFKLLDGAMRRFVLALACAKENLMLQTSLYLQLHTKNIYSQLQCNAATTQEGREEGVTEKREKEKEKKKTFEKKNSRCKQMKTALLLRAGASVIMRRRRCCFEGGKMEPADMPSAAFSAPSFYFIFIFYIFYSYIIMFYCRSIEENNLLAYLSMDPSDFDIFPTPHFFSF